MGEPNGSRLRALDDRGPLLNGSTLKKDWRHLRERLGCGCLRIALSYNFTLYMVRSGRTPGRRTARTSTVYSLQQKEKCHQFHS